MAYARDIGSGIDLVGGLIQQGAQTQDYINGLFDQHAQKKAGEAVARGDYDTASGLLGARGKIDAAETLRGRSTDRRVLKAIDTGDFDTARSEAANAGDSGAYGAATSAEDQEKKERASWLGHAADALLQIPDEAARHEAFASSIAPVMKSMGVADDMIAQIGAGSLTNEQLIAFKASIGQLQKDGWKIVETNDGPVIRVNERTGETQTVYSGRGKADWKEVKNADGSTTFIDLNSGETSATRPTEGGGERATTFDAAIEPLLKREGGFVASDGASGAPANFGINQAANPDVDVRSLTKERASQLYKTRYWDAIDADSLPANVRELAFDTAVNHGVGRAKELLKEAGNDPARLLELRREEYERLGKSPKHAASLPGWRNRLAEFEGSGEGDVALGSPEDDILGGRRSIPGSAAQTKEREWEPMPEDESKEYGPGKFQRNVKTGEVKPISSTGREPTVEAKKATAFAYRTLRANDRMNALVDRNIIKPQTATESLFNVDKSGVMRVVARTEKDRLFFQAAKEWLAPVLRKDTGAAVTDNELASYMDIYIPRFEDSPAVIRQKAEARQDAMIALVRESGPLFNQTHGKRTFQTRWGPKKVDKAKSNTVKLPSGRSATIEVIGD